jgi:ABC-type cobalamin transport system permease subunit
MTRLREQRRVRRRAGASAQREYERLKKQWRLRNRRFFLIVNVVAALVISGTVLLTLVPGLPRPWLYVLGACGGASLTFVLSIREMSPGWIEQWQQGAIW